MLEPLKRCILLALLISAIVSCSNLSSTPNADVYLHDQHFTNYSSYTVESQEEIFDLNPEAIAFVEQVTEGYSIGKEQLKALVGAIFDRSQLSLNYSAQANTTANQTFERGDANCLSLTIMAFSMAKHIGFDASFVEVDIPEFWTRRGGNTLINGHINLHLKPEVSFRNNLIRSRPFIVDFDPLRNKQRFNTNELTKKQIVAHFYLNKAADAMINKNSDLAYAYLKAAINMDKTNASAYLNLGVLYSRNNLNTEAELAYKKSLYERPDFSTAIENLAHLYHKTNRIFAAKQILAKLRRKRDDNPYYHFAQANLAAENGKYQKAITLYKKSINLHNDPHEFHFNLAKAYFALGDIKNTRRYLNKAKKRADSAELEQRYASKLSFLAGR